MPKLPPTAILLRRQGLHPLTLVRTDTSFFETTSDRRVVLRTGPNAQSMRADTLRRLSGAC